MNTEALFSESKLITEESISFYNKTISKLTTSQLNWKPNNASWNITEIIAHLNIYASFYHQEFTKRIQTTKFTNPKPTFISSPLGKSAWSSIKLGNLQNIKRKFKTQKIFNPSFNSNLISENTISEYYKLQSELLEIIENAKKINIQRTKCSLSISKLIRLRFGDTLLFVVYHNQRHIQQIKNLISQRNFPK